MAEGKDSFILYAEYLETVSKLTDAKAGRLFKVILEYVNDKNPTIDDLLLQIAFEPIKQRLKKDLKKWEAERSKRSEAGKKGGIKSGESRKKRSKRSSASKNEANEADNDIEYDNDIDSVSKDKFNKREISENEILNTIEFCSITLHRKYEQKRIKELWTAFLIQNNDKSYLKNSDQITHFRNWIKTQPHENGKHINRNTEKKTGLGNKSGGFGILNEALGQTGSE